MLPAANKYLDNAIANFYRREHMHVMIWTFMDTYRNIMPSVTLIEAAKAFCIRHNIDEELYSQDTVVAIYHRIESDFRLMNKTKS